MADLSLFESLVYHTAKICRTFGAWHRLSLSIILVRARKLGLST